MNRNNVTTKRNRSHISNGVTTKLTEQQMVPKKTKLCLSNPHILTWTSGEILGVPRNHPIPCVFGACLLFFMAVEYTLRMVPFNAPPFDLGFVATVELHRFLSARPLLNTVLAGLNTCAPPKDYYGYDGVDSDGTPWIADGYHLDGTPWRYNHDWGVLVRPGYGERSNMGEKRKSMAGHKNSKSKRKVTGEQTRKWNKYMKELEEMTTDEDEKDRRMNIPKKE